MPKYSYKYVSEYINIPTVNGVVRKQIRATSREKLLEKKKKLLFEAEEKIKKLTCPLFSDVADEWYENVENKISHYTYECYKAPLKDLKEAFGNKFVTDIKAKGLQSVIDTMFDKKYARQTISLRRIVFNLIMNFAVLQDYIEYNPCAATRVPRGAPRSHYRLPSDEEIEIIKNSIDLPMGLFYYFLYSLVNKIQYLIIFV